MPVAHINLIAARQERAALREKRTQNVDAMRKIHAAAERESRNLSASERKEWDKLDAIVTEQGKQLDQATKDIEAEESNRSVSGGRLSVSAHESVYRAPDDRNYRGHSYIGDLIAGARGDLAARERLEANNREWDADLERRGMTSNTAGSGGDFAPPVWSSPSYDYVPLLRAGRPFLDELGTSPLPLGVGSTLLLPSVSVGASVTEMASEGAAVSNTDQTTATSSLAIGTVSGRSVISQQLLALGPLGDRMFLQDLESSRNTALDLAALLGTTTNRKGAYKTTGISTVSATTGTLVTAVLQAVSKLSANFLPADLIVMNPKLWLSYIAGIDATDGRPISELSAGKGVNVVAVADASNAAKGVVGSFAGIPVVLDANAPTDFAGDASGQCAVLVMSRAAFSFLESGPRIRIADQVNIANLQVQAVSYSYFAQVSPYPKGLCVVSGAAGPTVATAGF